MKENQKISLCVVLENEKFFTLHELEEAISSFDADLQDVVVSDSGFSSEDGLYAEISLKHHKIKICGIPATLPSYVLERAVDHVAMYGEDAKKLVYKHKSHIILFYEDGEEDIFDQYTVLTIIGACLVKKGAIAIINEAARNFIPSEYLISENKEEQMGFLRSIPLLCLYCGLQSFVFEDSPEIVVSRTYGAEKFGINNITLICNPDLISTINPVIFFSDILLYIYDNKTELLPGETSSYGEISFTIRKPSEDENSVISDTIILEPIS